MGDVVVGRESVGECIDLLESRYGRFAVNQTTVTVSAAGYERAYARIEQGLIDAYVRVWNDDGRALHLRCTEPFAVNDGDASLAERVRGAVRTEMGVEATIEDVGRVTIAGIHNEDDEQAPAIYRLFVLFDANYTGGTPEDGEWEPEEGAIPAFVSGT